MKHILIVLAFVAISVRANFSYTENSPEDKIRGQPGKCYIEELGLFEKGNPIKIKDKCKTVKCLDDGKIEVTICPPLIVEPPCYAVYPTEKPLPECCNFEVKCLRVPKPPTPPQRV
ncbi:hypothetical protein HHI36_010371 [Cryptolaemus montrouzieri]|uniref:Single domain-containing protein n=1 Tax=Cryptolaemus montrouzieri TaxID=559131 RepID=A0ABD2MIK5_9CUCU